jgi:hypothetical protein
MKLYQALGYHRKSRLAAGNATDPNSKELLPIKSHGVLWTSSAPCTPYKARIGKYMGVGITAPLKLD